MKRKPLPPPVVQPHDAVVLAVDPGTTSGWSLWLVDYLVSGFVDAFDHAALDAIVATAVALATDEGVPCVLLLERPWSARTLGPSRALWRKAWERAGCSARRVVLAWPSRWRSQLLGIGGRARTEQCRIVEAVYASRIKQWVQHDEAAAICIGAWGTRSGEVGAVLPKSKRRMERLKSLPGR